MNLRRARRPMDEIWHDRVFRLVSNAIGTTASYEGFYPGSDLRPSSAVAATTMALLSTSEGGNDLRLRSARP